MFPTSILVPLYIYPLREYIPSIWEPLLNSFASFVLQLLTCSIRTYPNLRFIVVINPNTGPDPQPDLPDPQYRRAVPYLQGYTNVTLVGYVSTLYGKRNIQDSIDDIDLYWRWQELSLAKKEEGVGPMGLDGIFIDEVDCNGDKLAYFGALYGHIKSKSWNSGKPGETPNFPLSDSRLCRS